MKAQPDPKAAPTPKLVVYDPKAHETKHMTQGEFDALPDEVKTRCVKQ